MEYANDDNRRGQGQRHQLLGWYSLSEREKHVWAVRYGSSHLPPFEAAKDADRQVLELRNLDIDEHGSPGPEHEAARGYSWMEYEEFRSWYPTAMKIKLLGNFQNTDLSEQACRDAYEVYRRCAADFY